LEPGTIRCERCRKNKKKCTWGNQVVVAGSLVLQERKKKEGKSPVKEKEKATKEVVKAASQGAAKKRKVVSAPVESDADGPLRRSKRTVSARQVVESSPEREDEEDEVVDMTKVMSQSKFSLFLLFFINFFLFIRFHRAFASEEGGGGYRSSRFEREGPRACGLSDNFDCALKSRGGGGGKFWF